LTEHFGPLAPDGDGVIASAKEYRTLRRRFWALVVIAAGGTLLNVQVLAATSQPPNRPIAVRSKAPAQDWIATARTFGLYADTSSWSTPPAIAFSERETLLLTALGLVLIAALPTNEGSE